MKADTSSTISWVLLMAFFFLNTFVQSGFSPMEWIPEVYHSKQCELATSSNVSNALATVEQLMKSNDIAPFLPKSCMEIKNSSPVSPSGYYTISNKNGGAVVVYCNMDELYPFPSLEQTLKGFSDNLVGLTNTMTIFTSTVTGISRTLTAVWENVTEISSDLARVSNTLETNSACERISTSCQEVWDKCPKCTSGYYKLLEGGNTEKYVYCDFEERCGTAGPWKRVAYLNMSDEVYSTCPGGTQEFVNGSIKACGISGSSGRNCISVINPVPHSYSQVCGQVAGYQKGSTDGFTTSTNDINSYYLDGISITQGSPRKHLWSYAIGIQENNYNTAGLKICSCGTTSTMEVPSFVGNDYYCESGCPGFCNRSTMYSNDVLWDGQQCGVLEANCCTIPNQPWFHKVLDTPSIDDIEIRLCIDSATYDENVLVSLYEIYVK